MSARLSATTAVLAVVVALPACRNAGHVTDPRPEAETAVRGNTVQPGAPGDATGPVRAVSEGAGSARAHTAGDTSFMQGMISHHAQALEMTALVSSRSDNEDFRLLARRIDDSQRAEIVLMQRWLRDRGETVPDPMTDAHHGMGHGHGALMPGMLTAEEMSNLRQSTGGEFERLFLTYMISHHEGALVMVQDLLALDGAAQDGEVFRFAADVDADQRMEIRRMSTMLEDYQNSNNTEDE